MFITVFSLDDIVEQRSCRIFTYVLVHVRCIFVYVPVSIWLEYHVLYITDCCMLIYRTPMYNK